MIISSSEVKATFKCFHHRLICTMVENFNVLSCLALTKILYLQIITLYINLFLHDSAKRNNYSF